jgi:hypothetical protein
MDYFDLDSLAVDQRIVELAGAVVANELRLEGRHRRPVRLPGALHDPRAPVVARCRLEVLIRLERGPAGGVFGDACLSHHDGESCGAGAEGGHGAVERAGVGHLELVGPRPGRLIGRAILDREHRPQRIELFVGGGRFADRRRQAGRGRRGGRARGLVPAARARHREGEHTGEKRQSIPLHRCDLLCVRFVSNCCEDGR